ncbi:MAG: hypothetical protein WA419_10390 [Silvibacterium sp.]
MWPAIKDWFRFWFSWKPDIIEHPEELEAPDVSIRRHVTCVRYLDLPLGEAALQRVPRRPIKGQFAADGFGNLTFHKDDLYRKVLIDYFVGRNHRTKTVQIGR